MLEDILFNSLHPAIKSQLTSPWLQIDVNSVHKDFFLAQLYFFLKKTINILALNIFFLFMSRLPGTNRLFCLIITVPGLYRENIENHSLEMV